MENIKEENKFNYFAYELDNLLDLHYEFKKSFKLISIMNTSKAESFISILLSNIIFNNKELEYISDNDNSDYEYNQE
jgi:hypothetical protein|tara:strand:+ start:35 stop:265 length:231 start_codon:yes stop_codon:yes gene_type:complete